MKERGKLNNGKVCPDYVCLPGTRQYLEKVLEIETRYHNGEVSKRFLKYADLMEHMPAIDAIVKEKGYKLVSQYSLRSLTNEELEEAIDLHIEYMEKDEMELSRCFVWALCVPSVLSAYIQMFHTYVDNCRIYKDLKSFEDTYINIAYEEFCDVLSKHILHYKNGDFGNGKGALKYVFQKRLLTNVTEEFIENEFGPFFGYLNRTERTHEKSKENFYWTHGYEPSIEDLAEYLNVPVRTVREREARVVNKRNPVFLDQHVSRGFNIYERCWFGGKTQKSLVYYEVIADSDVYKILAKHLPKEKLDVVRDRYGFNETQEGMTISQIADKWNISVHNVKKNIREAHAILRPYLTDYVVHTL